MTLVIILDLGAKDMTHLFRIALVILLAHWHVGTAQAIDAAEIFRASKGSVVLLATTDAAGQPKSIGSGFFVGDGSRIVTNLHVIEGAAKIFVKTGDGTAIEIVEVAGVDAELDVVILVSPQKFTALPLAITEPEIGDEILAIGNPQGLEATLSTGIISGIRTDEGNRYYQITAPISPGSSGGPIISDSGEVIGIASFYVSGGQNLNFAVPTAYIRRLLNNESFSPIATAAKALSKPKKEINQTTVRLVDIELIDEPYNARIVARTSDRILIGYVQNKTEFPVHNVRISISYYRGDTNNSDNNRGYHECVAFVERSTTKGLPGYFSGITIGAAKPSNRVSTYGAVIHSQTAEKFSCALPKWGTGLEVVARLIDYELVR